MAESDKLNIDNIIARLLEGNFLMRSGSAYEMLFCMIILSSYCFQCEGLDLEKMFS